MSKTPDLETIPAFADRLADVARDSVMPHFRAAVTVETKSAEAFDPVTEADRGAEAAMRRLIAEVFPEHGVIGEEYGPERGDADLVWVLDPIDGTRAFIAGLPVWGTLIGLLHRGKPVFGMMSQPFIGERFVGDGHRAWYDGPGGRRRLATRPCAALGDATLFTTSPFLFDAGERESYDRVEAAVRLARYGCDCYGYCMVAAGHADIVVEAGLKSFDVVALIPILEGAGGRLTSWDDGSAADGGRVAASGDPRLHAPLLRMLAE